MLPSVRWGWPPAPEPLQVSIVEAARLLAYDTNTIRRLIKAGELETVKPAHVPLRIPMQSLRDFLDRHRTTPAL